MSFYSNGMSAGQRRWWHQIRLLWYRKRLYCVDFKKGSRAADAGRAAASRGPPLRHFCRAAQWVWARQRILPQEHSGWRALPSGSSFLTPARDGIKHICQRALRQRGDGRAPGGARDDNEGASTLGTWREEQREAKGRREKYEAIQQWYNIQVSWTLTRGAAKAPGWVHDRNRLELEFSTRHFLGGVEMQHQSFLRLAGPDRNALFRCSLVKIISIPSSPLCFCNITIFRLSSPACWKCKCKSLEDVWGLCLIKIITKPLNYGGQGAATVKKVNWACGRCRLVPSESECSSEKLQRPIPRAHVGTLSLALSNEFRRTWSAPNELFAGFNISVCDSI